MWKYGLPSPMMRKVMAKLLNPISRLTYGNDDQFKTLAEDFSYWPRPHHSLVREMRVLGRLFPVFLSCH